MNTIVSVRIPEAMVKDLRDHAKKDHFLDLSEAVRSVVRKKWMEWKDPTAYEIKKLRKDISQAITEKSKKTKEEQLLDELKRIREMVENKEVEK